MNKTKKEFIKKILNLILRIVISFGLLTALILINFEHLESIPGLIKTLNPLFLLSGMIFFFLSIAVEAPRWSVLLKSHKINIPLPYLLNSILIGCFYNTLLPTSIGGDVYRGIDLHKKYDISIHKNILSLFLGRFLGIISGILFLLISFCFKMYKHLSTTVIIGLIIFLPMVIFMMVLLAIPKKFKLDILFGKIKFLKKYKDNILEFSDVLDSYKQKGKYVAVSFLISMLSNIFSFISFYLIGLALKINIGFLSYLFIIPVTWAIANIPITIGGFGLRENTLVILLKEFGVNSSTALTFSLIVLVMNIMIGIIGGITLISKHTFYKHKKISKKTEEIKNQNYENL